jgi:hypothetical protein
LSVNIVGHEDVLISMAFTMIENVMMTKIGGLVMAGQVFEAMNTLPGDS